MDLTYPHSPDAEWRIAVSRRFNVPRFDSTYRSLILPVLEGEGLVLECSYASDSVLDNDFWMNRIDLILELADIHILVDIERSPNMEFEFERSARISRLGRARALPRNIGWSPMRGRYSVGSGNLPRPITIVIKEGRARDKLAARRLKAILYFSAQTNALDFAERLRKTVHWAKSLKLKGLDRDDLKLALVRMTEIARRIVDGHATDDLRQVDNEIASGYGEIASGTRHFVNEAFKWRVDLKNGNVKIPGSFRDTYEMLRSHSADGIGSLIPGFDASWPIRLLIAIGSFLMAIKISLRNRQSILRSSKRS